MIMTLYLDEEEDAILISIFWINTEVIIFLLWEMLRGVRGLGKKDMRSLLWRVVCKSGSGSARDYINLLI